MERLDKVCVKFVVILICYVVLGQGHVVNWEHQVHERNEILVSKK